VGIYDLDVTAIDGTICHLADFRGRTLLIVNVASACGFTPQYAGLEALYRKHRAAGFVVLGFPCDQFGHQEPGTEAAIQEFCAKTYDVTFPMFSKVDVNGPQAHPLFRLLKQAQPGILGSESIKWNFSKFLVGPDGTVRARYGSRVTPAAIEPDLTRLGGLAAR
jgi:glutathione peroxidase